MASASLESSQLPSPLGAQSPTDLRHITSNPNLASPTREHRLSKKTSQHLRTSRLGSRSPASIPSSPTSVHSSSSAIFERDIEPINPSPPSLTLDPHHIPRARHTESLDQSVPSVLDSAAEILTTSNSDEDGLDNISIVAPVQLENSPSGFTSPISRLSSRSPSPVGNRRLSALMNMPSPSPSFTLPLPAPQPLQSPSSPVRPVVQTNVPATPPAASTPTSTYFSVNTGDSSPTTATHHEHPLHHLPTPTSTSASPISHGTSLAAINIPSHPPSPKNTATKRLSFISYTDLLSSTPSSSMPLSSLTLSVNEPPHLPSVLGLPQAQAQHMHTSGSSAGSLNGAAGLLDGDSAAMAADGVGGEWEREGLGRGLEERLESLMAVPGRA
ncbi:hypothetical protein EIP91_002497 [Steccherinum ochraceum]|uniref:Uncharacterized protein n=1 Tax=Steccherinum ochraceum TaxID=92696 RepID=A0A4R0REL5_9APHY|nr:hypothetical protein EIP91_002497 [Steccherinum ochraceum]